MNKVKIQRKTLIIVSGIVFLSAISMIAIIFISLILKSFQEIAIAAAIVMVVLTILHLLILFVFLKAIKINNRGGKVDDGLIYFTGFILLFFSIVIVDGAVASLDNMSIISILMFVSVFCDFVAGLITVVTVFLLRKQKKPKDQ